MEKAEEKKSNGHGGARKGAGRPKGAKNHLSVVSLLEQVYKQSNGQDYEELLVQDFMEARDSHNKDLTLKYHTLILGKVMNNLAKIEITEGAEAIEAKKLAFAEALAKFSGIEKE